MNSSQQKTLEQIFAVPVRKNIAWRDIESLFIAIGCEVIKGSGSRVAFRFGQLRADFHRSHPNKEAKPYQVRDAKEFLMAMGHAPSDAVSRVSTENPPADLEEQP
jgi:HicA toxin of bacterial toxin-antitoxin,